MKTVAVAGLLLIGVSGQVFSMGHPHNVFAARKQMRAKSFSNEDKTKINPQVCCATVVRLTKDAFSKFTVRSLMSVY